MLWILLPELLVRSAVLLLCAGVLRLLMAKANPALRHRVLLCAFLLLALLPFLSLVLPALPLPRWPGAGRRAQVTVRQLSIRPLNRGVARQTTDWAAIVWLSGIAVALLPLVSGAFSARRIVREAKPLVDGDWNALLKELQAPNSPGTRVSLLVSPAGPVPFAYGLSRHWIVLPEEARQWAPNRRRAVLSHELAHIERRDLVAQLSVHVISAIWWFQPLVWFSRRALRVDSELACDTAALDSGLLPSEYAAELVQLTRAARVQAAPDAVALSIARRSGLEARLHCILAPRAPRLHSLLGTRIALALLTSVALAASTVTGNSHQSFSGGIPMKRSLFTALLTSAGLSAATVSGSLSDPNGAAVTQAKVLLFNAKTGTQQEVTSGQDGRFDLENAPAGAYVLHVEKPGFSPILRAFNLQEDSRIDRGFTLAADGSPVSLNKFAPPESGGKRVRVGGQIAEANLTTKVQPVYPAAAKAAGTQGTVELEAVISNEGVPLEIRVVQSPSEELSNSALEAVSQWRYRPVLLNGNPIEVQTTVIVNYTLSQ